MAPLLVATALAAALQAYQLPPNSGFETFDASGRPTGWNIGGEGFEIVVDSVAPLAGRVSLRTRWVSTKAYSVELPQPFAVATQFIPVWKAAGRKLRLTGHIRTENIGAGYAGFWMRVDRPGGVFAFDNMRERGPRGTTLWTRFEIELPVDSGATGVMFGVVHPGDGSAWFDSISVEVVGSPMPRMVAAFTPPSRPPEDMSRLLTDAELALPRDSVVIPEDPEYAAWVKANAHPIRSLGATDFADLRFLAPLLATKRIVQLGESGHGVAEFNMAKVRLIKYLHRELGYDVIAFESSMFECERAQKNVASLSPIELMRACIFGVWHTEETLPLFEYIKETQRTARPLILAGFDAQTSTPTALRRPALFRWLIEPIDSAYAERVYETDHAFLKNRGTVSYVAANEARLVAFYDSLATFLRVHSRAIQAAHVDDPKVALVARQAAISMSVFVRQLAVGPSAAGTDIRDLGMANNLDFLLDELYPGKKVIVWGHNFHIQHRENARVPGATGNALRRTMGTWVAERRSPELYTIGLFMYRGSAAQNDRRPYPIAQARSGSLESIMHRAPWRYSFVDFSRATRQRGSEWMWTPINAFSWGTTPERLILRNEYDGVLFIDTVHLPVYR
jgi:erythromycin esterase